jgi:signal peptidase I
MFIAQPFIVRGESMFPTFENKEYLIVEEISYHLSDPMRGDVVVFKYPLDPKQFFIKRIIGLPGETVSVSGGVVTIFNTENPGGLEFQETFLDEWEDTRSPLTLENDEYFVMGDNRENSSDSRRWGPVNEKLIVGRAFIRLWPLDNLVIRPGEQEEEYN